MAQSCVTPTFVEEVIPNSILVNEDDDGCDCDDDGIVGILYNDQAFFDDTYNFS